MPLLLVVVVLLLLLLLLCCVPLLVVVLLQAPANVTASRNDWQGDFYEVECVVALFIPTTRIVIFVQALLKC